MAIWIDEHDCELDDAGNPGFLIKIDPVYAGTGLTYYQLRQHPTHDADGPVLDEHAATIDGVARYGRGLAKVVRRAANGRVCLARVPATAALLEELGYPELADDDMVADAEATRYDRWIEAMKTAGVNLDALTSAGCDTDAAWHRAYAASVAMLGS